MAGLVDVPYGLYYEEATVPSLMGCPHTDTEFKGYLWYSKIAYPFDSIPISYMRMLWDRNPICGDMQKNISNCD